MKNIFFETSLNLHLIKQSLKIIKQRTSSQTYHIVFLVNQSFMFGNSILIKKQSEANIQNFMFRYTLFVALFVILNSLVLQRCPLCNAHMTSIENPHFTLTLQYSVPQGKPVSSSKAKVFWNGKEIRSLEPQSHELHTLQVNVKAVQGSNKLTISGSKGSAGIIVDNVRLIRQGTDDNIVSNGNFQKTTSSENTFEGWRGLSKKVKTTSKNSQKPGSQAALITSDPKHTITQIFKFDREYRLQTEHYHLSFLYAVPQGTELKHAKAKVHWNSQSFNILPTDENVKTFKAEVKVEKGKENILKIAGEGSQNNIGLTISNVKLIPLGSAANIIINGDFSIPKLKKKVQEFNYLLGWDKQNKVIKIGRGTQFNSKWQGIANQVITLGNKENIVVSQKFNFGNQFNYLPKEQPYFTISFNYAALDAKSLKNSAGEILIDNEVIAEFIPDTEQVQNFNQRVTVKPGINSFKIRPKKGKSIVIGNFKMIRMGKWNNLASNGDFSLPSRGTFIPGWQGTGQIVTLTSSQTNSKWQSKHAIILTSKSSNQISQSVELDNQFKVLTNKFELQLEYAPTEKAQHNTPLAWVTWNGQDFPLSSKNQKVHIFKKIVVASRGQNQLTLSGKGKDGQGLTIDNVKLIPLGSSTGALSNGDFEAPYLNDDDDKKTFHLINDWQGTDIQLGFGTQYNENWPEKSGQVLSLATKHLTVLSRAVFVAEDFSLVSVEPRQLALSFSYGAYQGKPLDKSGGQIFWNKVLIGDIQPQNYNINKYSITFNAKVGENKLFIKGAGGIQAYGLTLDDIKLVRVGTEDNLVENGRFQAQPSPGWNSIVKHAPLINHHWSKSNVGKIDAVQNLTLSKTFNFDSNYRLKTNKFTLKFDYTLREGSGKGAPGGTCTWNDQTIKLKPTSFIQSFTKIVYGIRGENILKFQGEKISIDNVRLIPQASTSSVLVNGDFQSPQFSGDSSEGLPSGWNVQQVQFAKSFILSKAWPFSAGQSISLNKRKEFISQIITLSKDKTIIQPEFSYYSLQFDFAAISKDSMQESKGEVYWNNRKVGTFKPTTNGINKYSVKIDAVYGSNVLDIKGVNEGIVVSNVKLLRYGSNENIVENSDFSVNGRKNEIAFWVGNVKIGKSEDHSSTWKGSKVVVLNPKNGGKIQQNFNFDGNLRFLTKKLVLSFQYTVRQGVKFESAKAKFIWNDKVIQIHPKDYDLHLYNEIVEARTGNNFLIFKSDGIKRHFGIFAQGFTIDNVWIRQYGSSKNLLINGGFQEPKVEGFDYGMFTNKVPGWTTPDIYVGVGYYFSKNWKETQIIQLDGNKQNAKIMQGIQFSKHYQAIQ